MSHIFFFQIVSHAFYWPASDYYLPTFSFPAPGTNTLMQNSNFHEISVKEFLPTHKLTLVKDVNMA
jgi:hypothetical protein